MTFDEVKQAYEDKVEDYFQDCVKRLNSFLITNCREIEKDHKLEVPEDGYIARYSGNRLAEEYREDVITKLNEHYSDWDIEIISKDKVCRKGIDLKPAVFIFTPKNLKEVEKIMDEVTEMAAGTTRFEMMDVDNEK